MKSSLIKNYTRIFDDILVDYKKFFLDNKKHSSKEFQNRKN